MTVDQHSIREAETDDWTAVAALLGRDPSDAAGLRRHVQAEYDPGFALVAENAGNGGATQAVGALVAGIRRTAAPGTPEDERAARLVWIGVAPPHRRRGLGTRLLDAALAELRARGATHVELDVDGTEVEALALFRKAGFGTDSQDLGLLLDGPAATALAALTSPLREATIRPLALDDVPLLAGLLIHLGMERATAPHDSLEALTPAVVEQWLQRPATVAFAAWERDDPRTPFGLAWASRRQDDAVLRFIGVHDDHRRHGIGAALLAALAGELGPLRAGAATTSRDRPLRAQLNEPGDEQEFFRALGFGVERITYHLSRSLR